MIARRVRDIDYQLLPGADRKTTDIVIERNGIIAVRPPKHFSPEQVDAIVDNKRLWIYKNLAEWRDLNAAHVVREWVNGETFLYLGRNYRLKLVSDQDSKLKLKNGYFCLSRSVIESGGDQAAKEALEAFFCVKGQQRLLERVNYFAPKAGVLPAAVQVKEHGFKWASCSKAGKLAFHWKCMMAPPKIIDYIVVHELCHFHYRDHSAAFWNEVDKLMPDYAERKAWLRDHGASLDL